MAEKGSKTILHRGFTGSIKNIPKTLKLTENTDIRKAMVTDIHWREASDEQEHWLMHWGWLKSDQTCTQANAGGVPSDRGQRQALVEPLSLPGVAWNVNEFLCKTAQEGGSGLAVHTSGFDCNWLKVVIVKNVIVFPAFVGLSISCCTAWYSSTDYVVTFCKGVHNFRVPYKAPASVPGVQGQTIGPSIFHQANGLKDRGETNAGQWSFEDGVYGWMSGEAARILNAGEAMKP